MFNIGPGEIVLISVVALLLLGPDKLPELARGLGKFFREFRKHTEDVRGMVEREFYRMDQDVLHDGAKNQSVEVKPVSRFEMPPSEAVGAEPSILPPATFPAFPAPEGVVPSRPPSEALPEPAPQTAAAEPPSADAVPRSDAVPSRDA